MFRRIAMSILVAAAAFASGCASTLTVKVMQPAPVNFGAARRVSVVQSEGRRSAREQVIGELSKQARGDGHFQVTDRTDEGITLKVAGRNATPQGGRAAQGPDEIYVRLDVLDWTSSKDTKTQQEKDNKGNVTREYQVVTYTGKVTLGITAANAQGQAILAEKDYASQFEAKGEDTAIATAAAQAVRRFLNDVTPIWVEKKIRMDDEDKEQKPIIEMARGGSLPKATEAMVSYLDKNPQNPAAMYNLAVFFDASGRYKEALDLYGRAIKASPGKEFYVAMQTECSKRLADQEALAK